MTWSFLLIDSPKKLRLSFSSISSSLKYSNFFEFISVPACNVLHAPFERAEGHKHLSITQRTNLSNNITASTHYVTTVVWVPHENRRHLQFFYCHISLFILKVWIWNVKMAARTLTTGAQRCTDANEAPIGDAGKPIGARIVKLALLVIWLNGLRALFTHRQRCYYIMNEY